jgi:hypothetical protein
MQYPKYATTVVGADSVPDWYESLDRLVAVGQLSMASMADARYRASQAAILDQETANIDDHRRRDAPANPQRASDTDVAKITGNVPDCARDMALQGAHRAVTLIRRLLVARFDQFARKMIL